MRIDLLSDIFCLSWQLERKKKAGITYPTFNQTHRRLCLLINSHSFNLKVFIFTRWLLSQWGKLFLVWSIKTHSYTHTRVDRHKPTTIFSSHDLVLFCSIFALPSSSFSLSLTMLSSVFIFFLLFLKPSFLHLFDIFLFCDSRAHLYLQEEVHSNLNTEILWETAKHTRVGVERLWRLTGRQASNPALHGKSTQLNLHTNQLSDTLPY